MAPRARNVKFDSLICMAAGLIGLAVFAIGLTIWTLRSDALNDAATSTDNIATVLAEQSSRSVQAIDLVLIDLQERVQSQNFPNAGEFGNFAITAVTHHLLRERLARLPQADVVAFVGTDGTILNTTRSWPAPKTNVGDRDYLVHFRNTDHHGVYISDLLLNRVSGHRTVFFSRRLTGNNGSFIGIALIGVKLSYFQEIFSSLQSLHNQSFALLRYDGSLLLRQPELADAATSYRSSRWGELVSVGGGHYRTNDIDGEPRLIAVRPLRDYPLVINVGVSENAALAVWRRRAMLIGIGTLLTILCSALLLRSLYTQFQRMSRSEGSLAEREARLAEANVRLDAALNNMKQGLCMFDADEKLVVCNERYLQMYHLPRDIVKPGCSLIDILRLRKEAGNFSDDIDRYLVNLRRQFALGNYFYLVAHLDDGRVVAMQNQSAPGGGWVATHEDITERQRAEARIAHMARHDALTDLANRVLFRERMDEALARLSRNGESFSIFIFDLDMFKGVNDSLGHPVGDALLKAVALRLKENVRETDTVARLGGDEFAILQTAGGNQRQEAVRLAERLLKNISAPYQIEGHEIVIGISIGIAVAPEDGADAVQLLKNADLALYRAKLEGRNDFRFFEDKMDSEARMRRSLEIDLRNAIAREEFELHYQTFIDVRTLRTVGVEALVRWRHPERGLVPPDRFIPLAEEIGLIVPLGEWILRKACLDAVCWPADIKLAVNLSAAQFRSGNLVQMVKHALDASGLPVNRLELEITESVLLQKNTGTLDTLHRLKKLGVDIVLDDFGTGYSSLSYLRMFPFDKIKIDQSFVDEINNRADCAAIVSAITSLGSSLGIATTAEGVEKPEQLALLQAAGCTHAQGYLFSRPRPAPELVFGDATPGRSKVA